MPAKKEKNASPKAQATLSQQSPRKQGFFHSSPGYSCRFYSELFQLHSYRHTSINRKTQLRPREAPKKENVNTHPAITSTRQWLKSFVIEYNICPFAHREYEKDSIRFTVITGNALEECLTALATECEHLDSNPDIETTLLIFPDELHSFNAFLDFLDIAQQLLIDRGYEGIYQLASFHPQYCFANTDKNDASNYTNRSPYPMFHIIREASIERALENYSNPENIPAKNIQLTRQLGYRKLQAIVAACLSDD